MNNAQKTVVVKWGRGRQHAVGNVHDYEGLCGARPRRTNFVRPSVFRGIVTCVKCVKLLDDRQEGKP